MVLATRTGRRESQLNTLYYGDNLDILRKKIKDETVDLCYIDPPFNSKRDQGELSDRPLLQHRRRDQSIRSSDGEKAK
jgi:DNA modification methylase